MNLFGILLFSASLVAAVGTVQRLTSPYRWVIAAAWLALGFFALLVPERQPGVVAALKGLRWKRSQFGRGWLITGDTGSGKTSSGVNQLAHQVFRSEPHWGGLCIDEKGVYWETLKAMRRVMVAQQTSSTSKSAPMTLRPDGRPRNVST